MAAKDITVGLGFDVDKSNLENIKKLLKDLKESSEKVPLGTEESGKIKKHFQAADKALAAGDWDSLRTSFNKITKILTQTLAATGNISEALQKSIDLKNTLEKQLNQLKEREAQIRSKYTKDMSHFLKSEAESNYKAFTKDEGKIMGETGNALSRDEALSNVQKVNEVLEKLGKTITQVTNDIAKKGGFASRQDFFKANRYAQQEPAIQAADKDELKVLEENQKDLSKDIAQVEQDIIKLQPASEAAAKGLEELYKQIVNISSELNKSVTTQKNKVRQVTAERTGGGAAKAPEEFASANKGLEKQSSTLGKVFKQWTLYSIALRSVKKAMREAVKTVKDLDKALTEQAMVTGLTRKQAYKLLGTYQDMAKNLGATTKEVASTMTAFLRQGRSIQEATELSNAAIAAAKVASISTADSVNYLTTAINGFRLSASDAMKVSDKFAAVAATAATSYEEIAIAMSKVAAQANLAGMSIDYTTALLTKGLETTREAPETIGTALKTVIARMRELTDYGATLEDGMNINNVEKQLAYVNIELRNQNGELRSTEDVLNELGGKWDKLSSNQQAAIAKALAGTRQQSRLIAMMQDYDRVIELQEIAERSQGATLAQMSTYLEGMDAALNRVNIAWEEIVSTLADSEVIIGLINFVSNFLDKLGTFLQTDFGVIATLTTVSILTASILGSKIREHQISMNQRRIEHEIAKQQNEQNKLTQQSIVQEKELVVQKLQNRLKAIETSKELARQNKLLAEQRGNQAEAMKYQAEIASLEREESFIKKTELPQAEKEVELENDKLKLIQQQGDYLESQDSMFTKLSFGLTGIISLLAMGVMLYKAMAVGIGVVIGLTNKETRAKMKAAAAEKVKAAWGMAGSAAAIPVAGWVIAAAILAALGIAAIVMAVNMSKSSETTEDSVKKMSAEIYKLTEKANELDSVINKFEKLDNHIIKTTEDLKEMNSLLSAASDSLDEDEKEIYDSLQTDVERLNFLKEVTEKARQETEQLERDQRNFILGLKEEDIKESAVIRDNVYALNNSALYKQINSRNLATSLASSTRKLAQATLEQLSVENQLKILRDQSKLSEYIDVHKELAQTLETEELTLADTAAAYQKAYDTLNSTEAKNAFEQANKSWLVLHSYGKYTLDYMEAHYSDYTTSINNISETLTNLGYKAEESSIAIKKMFEALASGASVEQTIMSAFGISSDSVQYEKIWAAMEKNLNTSISDIAQSETSFVNMVNNIYDTVAKWNSLTSTEKDAFRTQHWDLFNNEDGAKLWKALETGNYDTIYQALQNSDYVLDELDKILNRIDTAIQFAQDETEKQILQEMKAHLLDKENLLKADLNTRLEQEQKALNAYKDYLTKQKDALTDSLEKRKDAYQKYFDDINQESEDEEYEEQAQLLMTNLQKLSSSNSAAAQVQQKELEQQLQDLEKERLQTLRERAQEQVVSNIENEVSSINEKFDKLLESNQAMLLAMTEDLKTPEFLQKYISTMYQGATALETQKGYLDSLDTFGYTGINLENKVDIAEKTGNVIINIDDQEISLTDSESKDIRETVMRALRQSNINTPI